MNKKYVIFKDDDVGKDTQNLKRFVEIVLKNNAKASIGLIGKHLDDQELIEYLNSLDKERIEIFCHGYYHKQFPYIIRKIKGSKELPKTEFNKDLKKHDSSLKKYREVESKYLKTKAIAFGPQGNIWNEHVVDALVKNDFKLMFAWEKIKGNIITIPLSSNYKQNSLDDFVNEYKKHKNDEIFTLQFHHADLSEKQLGLLNDVIGFLKDDEKRIFITPSELLNLVDK